MQLALQIWKGRSKPTKSITVKLGEEDVSGRCIIKMANKHADLTCL